MPAFTSRYAPASHQLPRASVDCHCHAFEDPARYPPGTDRSYTPLFEPFSKYLKMCEVTGIERTVQVNSAIYPALTFASRATLVHFPPDSGENDD